MDHILAFSLASPQTSIYPAEFSLPPTGQLHFPFSPSQLQDKELTMGDFKKYLESSVIDEHEIVTYRILARRLEVHVNVAKQMLYEFHRCHKKQDDSIYATYIITGERKEVIKEVGDDEDEDEDMSGSPFEITPREVRFRYQKVVKLVGEEKLEEVKAEIENVKTVHVYSLGPSRIKDLSVLSACSERVRSEFVYKDEQAAGKVYGMILNHLATKTPKPVRPPARPHAVAGPSASRTNEKTEAKEGPGAKSKLGTGTKVKQEPKTKTEKKPAPTQMKRSQSAVKPALKKQSSSNLLTSWGNAANKKAGSNSSSTAHSPKTEEGLVGMDLDSDEDEDDLEPALLRDAAEDARKRREKYEELDKMMEMSDDEDVKPKPRRVREEVSEGEQEEAEEVHEPLEKKPIELPTGSVVNVVTEGGRRRGRRKVNKKVQVKDEDGYLVTKLEPGWESFSEEEPVPKPKPKPKPAPKGKKKNAGPMTGQGSINSYFFKK
ncbi:unnamed protein product [Tuber aestivum]|uniref:DNA polymerase delta subunit 3 n=1 Tax=Tuber aestivum TaxID=59557 RepID=A0A292Q7U8_9PEZI|nr:unnamed protein product [Tuber aestivum]